MYRWQACGTQKGDCRKSRYISGVMVIYNEKDVSHMSADDSLCDFCDAGRLPAPDLVLWKDLCGKYLD